MTHVTSATSKVSLTSVVLACCFAGIGLFTVASAASAATYKPTRTDDPVPNGCNPKDCSLREAVIAANAAGSAGSSTILLRPGRRYKLTRPGPGEDAAMTGDLDVTAPMLVGTKGLIGTKMRHRGTKLAVIDGNDIDRVFDIRGAGLRLVWTVVRGGHARVTAGDDGNGGAIRGGVLKLHSKSRLVGNVADGNGGAFATTLSTATFLNGGMSAVLLKGNRAAGNGGAVYVEGSPRRFLPMDKVRISNNSAGGSGGAIFGSGPAIRYSTIADNRSGENGGGIALSGTGSSGFDWSTVSGNRAALSGGGVYTTAPGGGPVAGDKGLFAANSTIANNRAGAYGGGIAAPGGQSTTDLESVTLARNGVAAGRLGGGLYLGDGDTVSVRNTILALNLAGSNTSDCFAVSGGSVGSLGHNLVGNPGGCLGFGAAGDLFGGRLGLGKLADNGGARHWTYGRPLQTIALLRGSRAIDNAFQVSFDERGVDRDDRPDIGAYERVTRRYRFVNAPRPFRCTRADRICARK
jgi:CSLREA domain-containing protein